jgi:hypothetical protein
MRPQRHRVRSVVEAARSQLISAHANSHARLLPHSPPLIILDSTYSAVAILETETQIVHYPLPGLFPLGIATLVPSLIRVTSVWLSSVSVDPVSLLPFCVGYHFSSHTSRPFSRLLASRVPCRIDHIATTLAELHHRIQRRISTT